MRALSIALLFTVSASGCSGISTADSGADTGALDSGGNPPALGFGILAAVDHSCVHVDNGDLHCWGRSHVGQLGLATSFSLGAAEDPVPSLVDVGAEVVQVVGGNLHTCALTVDGDVKCWGLGDLGVLGYGNTDEVGLTDAPSAVGNVAIGGVAVEIGVGGSFSCARMDNGDVSCWGQNYGGWLGQAVTQNIGDNETPDSLAPLVLGGRATRLAVGPVHSCAVLEDRSLRCWGEGPGTGHADFVGDDETPDDAGDPLGVPVDHVWVGGRVTCAQLVSGGLQCWGDGEDFELGRPGPTGQEIFGVEETVTNAADGPIHDFGDTVVDMSLGTHHSCALLSAGNVKCWGQHWFGVLGRGEVGSLRVAVDAPDVPLGGSAVAISGSVLHNCALIGETGDVSCWGEGQYGKLGQGSTSDIGDDETPESAGFVVYR